MYQPVSSICDWCFVKANTPRHKGCQQKMTRRITWNFSGTNQNIIVSNLLR